MTRGRSFLVWFCVAVLLAAALLPDIGSAAVVLAAGVVFALAIVPFAAMPVPRHVFAAPSLLLLPPRSPPFA